MWLSSFLFLLVVQYMASAIFIEVGFTFKWLKRKKLESREQRTRQGVLKEIYKYIYIYTCIHTYTYISISVYICVCVCVRVLECVYIRNKYINFCMCVDRCIYVWGEGVLFLYLSVCVCVRERWRDLCMRVYVYI